MHGDCSHELFGHAGQRCRPASHHDDLMVIYVDRDIVKADYFDNEGHVIRYVANAKPGEVIFPSDIRPFTRILNSRFTRVQNQSVFELAEPGKDFGVCSRVRLKRVR